MDAELLASGEIFRHLHNQPRSQGRWFVARTCCPAFAFFRMGINIFDAAKVITNAIKTVSSIPVIKFIERRPSIFLYFFAGPSLFIISSTITFSSKSCFTPLIS